MKNPKIVDVAIMMNKNQCIRIKGRIIEQGESSDGYKYAEISLSLTQFIKQMKDLSPKYAQIINEHFWELI